MEEYQSLVDHVLSDVDKSHGDHEMEEGLKECHCHYHCHLTKISVILSKNLSFL